MSVYHIPFEPFVNQSEERAFNTLRDHLNRSYSNQSWYLLTNIAISFDITRQADEIDMIAIGPTGVHVIEIKHWNTRFLSNKANERTIRDEANKLTQKVKKVAGKLRQRYDVGFLEGKFLLTDTDSSLLNEPPVNGVKLFSLRDWRDLLEVSAAPIFSQVQLEGLCAAFDDRVKLNTSGMLRSFASFTNLELVSPPDDRFHRIFKGVHVSRRERIILHVYDLSAGSGPNLLNVANREFEVIRRLQKSTWLPQLLDTFQPMSGYPGELYFFSLVDPAAKSLNEWNRDKGWSLSERIRTAKECFRAIAELHQTDFDAKPILHRNLTPETIRVRSNGEPLFTGLNLARLGDAPTVSPLVSAPEGKYVAPEICRGGLGAADMRSDVYSVCASLADIFSDFTADPTAASVLEILANGLKPEPSERKTPLEILHLLDSLHTPVEEKTPPVPPGFWDEETRVGLKGKTYRIISRLGAGGHGITFKVLEIDPKTNRHFGTYVGKVLLDRAVGPQSIENHRSIRHLTDDPRLVTIYEIADEWNPNELFALLSWVDGAPLGEWTGYLPLLAEERQETDTERFILQWIMDVCFGLKKLHSQGICHGDISPRNLLVGDRNIYITDYDLTIPEGTIPISPGTFQFCSPALENRSPISASDDIFALAATFFFVVFDREPFLFQEKREKQSGPNWHGLNVDQYPSLVRFLSKALAPDPKHRFRNAMEAVEFLRPILNLPEDTTDRQTSQLTPNRVEWLRFLLQSWPGSPYGNAETRGLDSDFAEETYVETELEDLLVGRVRSESVRLVILCGNAGDGKTALLQRIIRKLGLDKPRSSSRIWEHRPPNGQTIKVNFDGSAAFGDRSARELLDEFLLPFIEERPLSNTVHFVAINNGPLLEWIENKTIDQIDNRILTGLSLALQGEHSQLPDHILFIDLNARSLVGGFDQDRSIFSTDFLDRLTDKLLGGDSAAETWKPCESCSAKSRCQAWGTIRHILPNSESQVGRLIRDRLFSALQAVHLRGEVHITARELRSVLSYIYFGYTFCDDLHARPDQKLTGYFDLAFDPDSPHRQGETLRELARLDPALESHPQIDRYLLGMTPPTFPEAPPLFADLTLAQGRRRGYFEWNSDATRRITTDGETIRLAESRHVESFKRFPVLSPEERLAVKRALCRGLSRLEELPRIALDQADVVPLKILPRTPTESVFWINKPLSRFDLSIPPATGYGFATLHTSLFLEYAYQDGGREILVLDAQLFHVLMELKDGVHLSDTLSDDWFANVSIFTQRLAQEGDRVVYAWNPLNEHVIFEVRPEQFDDRRKLILKQTGVAQ